ncbi:MAG: hypothetical protein CV087_13050 [Candidatus Brocadia sp. WS118]|nr:MAG: hypothetical protein CV087_13050 [Candidatus Brocadia sp. WS118]
MNFCYADHPEIKAQRSHPVMFGGRCPPYPFNPIYKNRDAPLATHSVLAEMCVRNRLYTGDSSEIA